MPNYNRLIFLYSAIFFLLLLLITKPLLGHQRQERKLNFISLWFLTLEEADILQGHRQRQ